MRMNHDFPIDQLIAEASALRRFDGIAASVRIPVHEVGMQHADVRPMHLGDQAMRLEPDFGVNAVRTACVQNAIEERSRRCRCAK